MAEADAVEADSLADWAVDCLAVAVSPARDGSTVSTRFIAAAAPPGSFGFCVGKSFERLLIILRDIFEKWGFEILGAIKYYFQFIVYTGRVNIV